MNIKKYVSSLLITSCAAFFVFPASSNYSLKSYEFNNAGGADSASANYAVEGSTNIGEVQGASTNYQVNSGLNYTQNANVPTVTLVNSSNWYNKLHVTIAIQNNPTDTTYAIAISDDNWVTTEYVQDDNTVGATLGDEDYQTYANWGNGSGEDIIGLTPNTTYKVKVKAIQGDFSESAYGPEASAATSAVTLTFDIDIGTTAGVDTNPPYNIDFGTLTLGSVNTATDKIWVDLSTNAEFGGYVYIYGLNTGLRSANTNYTIGSASTNLTGAAEGYGVQAANDTALSPVGPFNGSSDVVGVVDTTIREILNSGSSPVTGGRASITVKAKAQATTPASNDYSDTITLVASGTF